MCQQWIKWCVFLAQNITDIHIVDIQKKVETSCSNIDVIYAHVQKCSYSILRIPSGRTHKHTLVLYNKPKRKVGRLREKSL